ncbi:MAG TPA: AzlD domain-containing protein [Dongiaceae bacterium]|jgi:uncharacterized membrane protein
MPDWKILAAIFAVGLTSYAMRAGGFVIAGAVSDKGSLSRLLRLAPGNLFVAFAAAGCLEGGLTSLVGSISAFAAMVITKREWAALAAGFAAAAIFVAFQK